MGQKKGVVGATPKDRLHEAMKKSALAETGLHLDFDDVVLNRHSEDRHRMLR